MEEKRKRGRPSKSETGETRTTITDPLLEPYYIEKDSFQFILLEKSTATRGFAGKVATGKETTNVIGYYTQLGNAIKKVISLRAGKYSKKCESLKEYVENWETLKVEIENLVNNLNHKI